VESHISQKTSEIWGTSFEREPRILILFLFGSATAQTLPGLVLNRLVLTQTLKAHRELRAHSFPRTAAPYLVLLPRGVRRGEMISSRKEPADGKTQTAERSRRTLQPLYSR
jgi:hypothetical protein